MMERKNRAILIGMVLAASIISAAITAMLFINHYSGMSIQVLGDICERIVKEYPSAEQTILTVIKEYKFAGGVLSDQNIIRLFGYRAVDFLQPAQKVGGLFVLMGFLSGVVLLLATLLFWRKKEQMRINRLTEYLEKVNAGDTGLLLQMREDEYSKLEDEIYKTVTTLYQTREAAIEAKRNFVENLDNIAHQIKTPITSISLAAQMLRDDHEPKHLQQIFKQISRLTHLEEALLLLSRIDAGTLAMERKAVDVFTLLTLAAENLQELSAEANVMVDVPMSDEITIQADLDWTMEAIMNLLKNCIEHTSIGGTVACAYEQNPLYTEIRIWDDGGGFAKEDIPHLFKRFYRGQKEKGDGIGIGLALSKAIIERQNGTISAKNLAKGGACFVIHFYSH